MANENEAIPSARVKCFLVPPQSSGRAPLLIGLVQDISLDARFMSENIPGVGDDFPQDNVINYEDGSTSFTCSYRDNPNLLRTIAPRIAEFKNYERFDILTIDPKDKKPLVMAKGCLPSQLRFNDRAGQAASLQYNGICQIVLRGDEITQAIAA